MADTPGAMPVLGDNTTMRFKLGTLCTGTAALIGFVFWLTTMYNKQDQQGMRMERMESDIREIKDELKNRFGRIP